MNNITCPKCGAVVEPGTRYCAGCGQQIENPQSQLGQPMNAASGGDISLFAYYLGCFKKYATFEGRARRKEYWGFALFNGLLCVVTQFFLESIASAGSNGCGTLLVLLLLFLVALGTLLPSLAVLVRRLHDCGNSGWFALLLFIPFIGAIIILIKTLTEGTVGENRYGPDPKPR